jgi:hypothetical protein
VSDVHAHYRLALSWRKVDLLALSLHMLALLALGLRKVVSQNCDAVVSQNCDAWYLALSEGKGLVVGTKDGAEVEEGRGVDRRRKWNLGIPPRKGLDIA